MLSIRSLVPCAVIALAGCADSLTAPAPTPATTTTHATAGGTATVVSDSVTYSFTVPTCNGDSAAINLVGQTWTTTYSDASINFSFVITIGHVTARSVKTGAMYTGNEVDASGAFITPTVSEFQTNTDFVLSSPGLPDITVNQLAVYAQDANGNPILQQVVNSTSCACTTTPPVECVGPDCPVPPGCDGADCPPPDPCIGAGCDSIGATGDRERRKSPAASVTFRKVFRFDVADEPARARGRPRARYDE